MLSDHGPGDLVVALSCGLHCVPCHVVERDHVGEDAHGLIEGTEPEEKRKISELSVTGCLKASEYTLRMMLPVIRSVTVLLQEVVFDQFGHLQGDFISFCQRCL